MVLPTARYPCPKPGVPGNGWEAATILLWPQVGIALIKSRRNRTQKVLEESDGYVQTLAVMVHME